VRTSSTNFYIRGLVFEPLLDTDKNGNHIPCLAESWTISPDGRIYTFNLRRGVTFHNGKELTAEDVKFSVEYPLDPKNGASGFAMMQHVEAARVKDKYTVEISLKRPDVAFLDLVSTVRPFPIVPEGSVPAGKRDLPGFPPGTGPFVFKEYKPSQQIVFVKHKTYWQKSFRFASLRAGDLDMIERTPYSFVTKIQKGEYPDLRYTAAKYSGYRRLLFNVADPPFNNLKLRQAVRYALDKQQYINGAFWGLGIPAHQLFPADLPWHVKLPEIKRDVARVRGLLKEAGVGPDFQAELVGQKSEEEELQVLHQILTTAGIKTKVVTMDRGTRERRESSGDFMITLSGSDIPGDPGQEFRSEFGCREEETRAKKRTENASGYCNKEVDRLLAEAERTTDQKKRYELYSKVMKIFHDEIPDIPLAFVPRFFTYQQKVKGFETDHDGRFNLSTDGFSRVWIAP
jgi:peptide/nickel transport system substrate-binding protein